MKRKPNFMMQNVGGANILVPLGEKVIDLNGIVTLNDTAAFMWDILADDCTVEELADRVAAEYDVAYNAALNDVQIFLNDLSKLGAL
jgi:hypothetical protein